MEGSSSSSSSSSSSKTRSGLQFPEERNNSTHFHYKKVTLSNIHLEIIDPNQKFKSYHYFTVRITTADNQSWEVDRNLTNLIELDKVLHECHFDRVESRLPEIDSFDKLTLDNLRQYISQLSELITDATNCSLVLSWLRLDNYGRQLKPFYDPNEIPEIAKGRIIRSYNDPDNNHIRPKAGDVVNILDIVIFRNNEYWMAQYNTTIVLFPKNFIQVTNFNSLHSSCLSLMSELTNAISDLSVTDRRNSKLNIIAVDSMTSQFNNLFRKIIFKFLNCNRVSRELITTRNGVFGDDLTHYLSNQTHEVPKVLKCCSSFIECFGLVDGIYRLSGQYLNTQQLREIFNEDNIPNLCEATYKRDVHSIASVLKMYFRELPDPVCTFKYYASFTNSVRNFDITKKEKYGEIMHKLKRIANWLPPAHFRTLSYLSHHLRRVSMQSRLTRMNSKALAIVWAPNLLRQKNPETAQAFNNNVCEITVTEFFIKFPEIIFELPDQTDKSAENMQ